VVRVTLDRVSLCGVDEKSRFKCVAREVSKVLQFVRVSFGVRRSKWPSR